ncbi:metallophosphoesterase [Candidatus Leptofilum sp.]|uniref:P-loop NTPase n=1 Tax=Candidatus Leptofilum sp. TaxID=3241576 RepID=UPI003B58DA1C
MALLELSMVTSAIVEMGTEAIIKKLGRQEAIIRTLKHLKLHKEPSVDDFEAIYAYALVEYGIFKPEPILNFFRNMFIRKAFKQAFYENDLTILEKEAEGIIDWNQETGQLGSIDYDPRREFASFTAAFHQIVARTRTPAEVKRDQTLDDIHQKTSDILEKLSDLDTLIDIRSELTHIFQEYSQSSSVEIERKIGKYPLPASPKSSKNLIRWLHLSDFHIGKDGYGQRQLMKYILNHIGTRVDKGHTLDMVFVTGDIANNGYSKQYEIFYEDFFLPLLDCLEPRNQENVFIIPGNHDVNRTEVRAVQSYDVLLRVPEFLEPTEEGLFQRQVIFPRFQAYVENDMTHLGDDHWLFSPLGTYQKIISIKDKNIGILGINTAWLSYSDGDRHELSAGKGMLEDGLETLQNCELKIVLGHHPLDWFLDTDLEPIRAILGRHNALYLHGHMHKVHSRYEEGGGYPFLTLQSGACFQARENDDWINRFLWCELDLQAGEISVEPLQWSRAHQSWVLDGLAFPAHYRRNDRWVLSLPKPTPVKSASISNPVSHFGSLEIPDGWAIVDSEYLQARNVGLSHDQALSFFDGRSPIWREALAPQIPRREIVRNLVDDLETARQEGDLRVTLLVGASGEGKTTALLQTVSDLVRNSSDWHILYRFDSNAQLPAELLSRLPDSGTWLVVSDDAEVIARRVFDTVKALRLSGRLNVQFLLCCRDTDWRAEKADTFAWTEYITFVEKRLSGLSSEDAQKVVTAWSAYGRDGLKELADFELGDAAKKLTQAAKLESAHNHKGSFFGAVLNLRWGKGLKNRIEDLLRKLDKRPLNSGHTLKDAFAYIVAMHAEDIPILSKVVLAAVLEIDFSDLKRLVLGPLGNEAVITTTGRYVFSRHRAIAQVALQILSDVFNVETEQLYINLVQSTIKKFVERTTYIPNIGKWNYLGSHFFDKGDQELGIRLTHAALDVKPTDTYFIVKLAQLYRATEQPKQSVQLFHSSPKPRENIRPYYHEWGLDEGEVGHYALGLWLIAFALSDQAERRPPDVERTKLSLAGLALAGAELFEQFSLPVFIEVCGAASQLGFRLKKLDSKTFSWLQKNQNRAKDAGVQDVSPQIALDRLQAGVTAAWAQRESELPNWILLENELTFRGLSRLLRI